CYSITSSTQISTLSLHDALPISLHAGIGPFQGLLRRRREHGVQTHGVGAVLVDGFLRVDTVVFRLRHFAHAGSLQRQTIAAAFRSEEHTSELQSRENLVCRLLLE